MALDICNFNPLDVSTPLSADGGYQGLDPSNCNSTSSLTDTILNCDGTNNVNNINTEKIADDLVNQAGMRIYYYRHLMDIQNSHPIYGDSCAEYSKPYLLKGYVNITSDESFLSFGGIMNENQVELQISFNEWSTNIGSIVAPQSNDKFTIPDLLCNRRIGFNNATFKVTDQGDGDIFENSSRWTITAKREASDTLPNEPSEDINDQVMDSSFAGVMDIETGLPSGESEESVIEKSVDKVAQKIMKTNKSNVYGKYYDD